MHPRVCTISYSLPPAYSGAGTQALSLAQNLAEKDVQITAITGRHTPDLIDQETRKGVTIRRLPVLRNRRLRHLSFFLNAACHVLRYGKEYDIVHLHGAYRRAIPIVAAARLVKIPTVVKMSMMGTDDPMTTRDWRFGGLLMRSLAQADAVVAITEELGASYLRAGLPPDRLVRIPNGVDASRFRPVDGETRLRLRKSLGLPVSAPVVLFVGIVHPRKGVDRLVSAWASVQADQPRATLILVGPLCSPSSSVEPAFRQRLHIAADQYRVRVWGQQEEVHRFYQAADLFVLPSRMEGLPNALLEAMACGLPAICSALPGVSEVIEHKRNGLLVPCGEPGSLSDAVSSLLDDTARARRLGHTARQTILRHYSLPAVADRYLDLYSSLITTETSPR